MPSMSKRERISDFVRSLEPAAAETPSQDYYGAFFQLWNAQKYYEAHDVLEQLWLVEKNAELARFYKALIQAAGAFVHLQKNFEQPSHTKHGRRLPPATRLFALALRNLEGLPNELQAFDLARFRDLLGHYRNAIVAVDFKQNPWSPEKAPRLHLKGRGAVPAIN
jgi:predicted metal-dependent hydrolase